MIVSYIAKVIKSTEDHDYLQQDLNTLVEWTKQWQMILNPAKCVLISNVSNMMKDLQWPTVAI